MSYQPMSSAVFITMQRDALVHAVPKQRRISGLHNIAHMLARARQRQSKEQSQATP